MDGLIVGDYLEWGENYHGITGAAHSISGDALENDIVEKLREVVREVTGKSIESAPRKIGFY